MKKSAVDRIGMALAAMFRDDEKISLFLNSPNPDLDECSPNQLICRGKADVVAEMLEDMLLGHPS